MEKFSSYRIVIIVIQLPFFLLQLLSNHEVPRARPDNEPCRQTKKQTTSGKILHSLPKFMRIFLPYPKENCLIIDNTKISYIVSRMTEHRGIILYDRYH